MTGQDHTTEPDEQFSQNPVDITIFQINIRNYACKIKKNCCKHAKLPDLIHLYLIFKFSKIKINENSKFKVTLIYKSQKPKKNGFHLFEQE